MAAAERVGVPLKSRCSRKCEAPASSSDSSREPVPTQNATATERTSAMVSVTRRMPLGRTERFDQRRRERPRGGRRSPPLLLRPSASTAPGPRSPSSATSSASKASSKEGTRWRPARRRSRRRRIPLSRLRSPRSRSRSRSRSPRSRRGHRGRGRPAPPPESPEDATSAEPSGTEASDSDTLPCGSMSSTRTSIGWPRVRTSSTWLTRLPPASGESLEMCSRPSRPGQHVDEGPELGDVDHLARVDRADVGRRRVEDERDAPAGLLDGVAVLGPDGHRAHHAVVVDGDVGARSPAAGC